MLPVNPVRKLVVDHDVVEFSRGLVVLLRPALAPVETDIDAAIVGLKKEIAVFGVVARM